MFAWAIYIFDRLLGPRTRADEVRDVRTRLAEQSKSGAASLAEEQVAIRLRALRQELASLIGEVHACSQCVRPRSEAWPGGHCCSGPTNNLFTDPELASLRLSGTTPIQLKPARADHRGCAFRGPKGCSLQTADRPNLCVRYICGELQSELDGRGESRAIAQLQEELRVCFDEFIELRDARLAAKRFEELRASLSDYARPR